jgi:hypothetical protein
LRIFAADVPVRGWREQILYRFQGSPDGWRPNGFLKAYFSEPAVVIAYKPGKTKPFETITAASNPLGVATYPAP